MAKADSRIALIAIIPAMMIPLSLGLRSIGVADSVVGFVEGASIGLMLLALAIAIRARAEGRRSCARTEGDRR